MKVRISEDIQANAIWLSMVATANGMIETEMGERGDKVSVEWMMFVDDALRPRFKVQMHQGDPAQISILFADFQSATELRRQIFGLCEKFRGRG
jgi:hypothetical protein